MSRCVHQCPRQESELRMANQRLKNAMQKTQLSAEDLSIELEVDLKTVQRWMNGSATPRPRKRQQLADLVGQEAYVLWPGSEAPLTGTDATDEVIAVYGQRADIPRERWAALIDQAEQRVDLLGFAMLHLPEQHPGFAGTLSQKASTGCEVRVALADPSGEHTAYRDAEESLGGALEGRIRTSVKYFEEQTSGESFSMRFHSTPLYNSIFRFDDQMIVTPHLYALPGYSAPAIHLRRCGDGGLFEKMAGHFERIWADSKPVQLP